MYLLFYILFTWYVMRQNNFFPTIGAKLLPKFGSEFFSSKTNIFSHSLSLTHTLVWRLEILGLSVTKGSGFSFCHLFLPMAARLLPECQAWCPLSTKGTSRGRGKIPSPPCRLQLNSLQPDWITQLPWLQEGLGK